MDYTLYGFYLLNVHFVVETFHIIKYQMAVVGPKKKDHAFLHSCLLLLSPGIQLRWVWVVYQGAQGMLIFILCPLLKTSGVSDIIDEKSN